MKKKLFYPLLWVNNKRAWSNGFTLIELMITISINGIIAATLFQAFYHNKDMFNRQNNIASLHQTVRSALHFISNAAINAGYDPLNNGFPSIDASSTSTSITFYADLNENGKIPPHDSHSDVDEAIVFSFDAKNRKIKNWLNQTIVEDIIDLTFTYEPPLPHTRIITISITGITENEDPSYKSGYNKKGTSLDGTCRTFTLSSAIAVRNSL